MIGWLVDERRNRPERETDGRVRAHDRTLSREPTSPSIPNATSMSVPGVGSCEDTPRVLHAARGRREGRRVRYRAAQHDCDGCMLKPKCCPNILARKIARSVHEAARDTARAIAKTEGYAVSCRERKKVGMLFAHVKRILRLGRLRLRGPNGAIDEFLLAATAQNLRKLAKPFRSRRRSSLHKAEGSNPSALIAVATAVRSCQPRGLEHNPSIRDVASMPRARIRRNRRSLAHSPIPRYRRLFRLGPQAVSVWRGRLTGGISKCGDRRLRTLLYEAANVMLTRYTGPAQTQGLGVRDRPAINDQQSAHRTGSPPRDHHVRDAAVRNRVRTGISPQSKRQEAEIQLP